MNMNAIYSLSLQQVEDAIATMGDKRTVLVQGHMGNGKSSLLKGLQKRFPNHTPCYFDCTTKDLGDLSIPSLNTAEGFVKYLPNEELGIHLDTPAIVMLDEFGKANTAVKNGLLAFMLERDKLPEGSIVFATTNLGAEGVGDLLPPHARNRIIVVEARKSSSDEWIEWGFNNGVDPSVLGFVKENPMVLQGFDAVKDPNDNPYIYHPRDLTRQAFVTPRSLEAASDILKQRAHMDSATTTALLIGAIGGPGAKDMMAFVTLADELPSLESIKNDPLTALVPKKAVAICMTVYRALSAIDCQWVDAWMQYMNRLPHEAQAIFVNAVRKPKYVHRDVLFHNSEFTAWCLENNAMFGPDKTDNV